MIHLLPSQRLVRGATDATITYQSIDADGDATTPAGTVTVSVTRSDGTAVTSGAVSTSGTGLSSATIGVAELTVVDQLTAVWSDNGNEVRTDTIDVIGAPVASIATIQSDEPTLATENTDTLKSCRKAAEDRFMSTQHRLPFERLVVQRFDGTGRTALSGAWFPDLVEVRWARVYSSATTYTALTAAELASIVVPDTYSRLERTDGTAWTCGTANIEVGYVAGLRWVPDDLRRAFSRAVRWHFTQRSSAGALDRASSWGSADGITFGVSTPGQRGATYGIPDIDDVFNHYRDPRPVVA